MRRRLVLLATLTGLLFVLTAACSSSGSSSAGPATTGAPDTTRSTGTAPSDPINTPPASGWRVWWIVGDHLAPGDVHPLTGGGDVQAALDALIAGPTPSESAFGAGTGLTNPKGKITLTSLTIDADGIAHVDFNRMFETADTRPQTAQVVYTLTQFPQVKKVQFLIDGQPNGATGVPPVGRDDLSFPTSGG